MRAAAEAIAVSWLKIDSASVSSTTHSAKVPLTESTGRPGEVQLAFGVAVDVAAEPEIAEVTQRVRVEEIAPAIGTRRRRT